MDEQELDPDLLKKQRNDCWYSVSITSNDMKALLRIRDHFAGEDKSQSEGLAFDVLDRNFGEFEYNF